MLPITELLKALLMTVQWQPQLAMIILYIMTNITFLVNLPARLQLTANRLGDYKIYIFKHTVLAFSEQRKGAKGVCGLRWGTGGGRRGGKRRVGSCAGCGIGEACRQQQMRVPDIDSEATILAPMAA